MLCFYAPKGGVGCSVVSCAVALQASRQGPTLLVDLGGDNSEILGVGPTSAGIFDWMRAASPPPDALARLEVAVGDRLSLLPSGSTAVGIEPDRAEAQLAVLARLLLAEGRTVVVDVGTQARLANALLGSADRCVLVTRACYLALRSARALPVPDEIVLIEEPGRALRASDVAESVGADVSVTLQWDPVVARAVDAGLLASRLPRSLRRLVVCFPRGHREG